MLVHPLRAAREQRGWSQTRLAEQLGVSTRTIARWEQGTAQPYPHYRQQLATLFQQSVQALGLLRDVAPDSPPQQVVAAPGPFPPSSSLSAPRATSVAAPEQVPLLTDPLIPHALGHPSRLVGRDALLSTLKTRLLDRVTMALTALHGLPGVGKTALAAALALDLTIQAHFPDGILWAALGLQPNVLAQLARWGTLLGIRPDEVEAVQQESAWSRALRATIGTRRMLLIIDDAWSSEAALAFQVGGPHCAHLLTTRLPQVAFAFASQQTLVVPELPEADGLALLARYVPELMQAEPEQARSLVQTVGGLPLALTLIGHTLAAQALTGQPRRLQHALQQVRDAQQRLRLSLLPVSNEPSPDRQHLPGDAPPSLQAAIALSAEHLSAQAYQALLALACYPPKPGSFSEEAALWVMASPVESLDELWDVGLLESSDAGRYTLHQTIVDYARAQTPVHQRVALQERLLSAWLPALREHLSDDDWLDQEWGTVQMVVDTALQTGPVSLSASELARLLSGLQPYLLARGLLPQAERYVQGGIVLAREQGDQEGHVLLLRDLALIAREGGEYFQVEQATQQGLQLVQPEQLQVRCDLLTLFSWARYRSGQSDESLVPLHEALELARQLQDAPRLCQILRDLAIIALLAGDYEQARVLLAEGLDVARQQELHERICTLLDALAAVTGEQGQLEQSKQAVHEGLQLAQHYGYRVRQAGLLERRGVAEGRQGQLEQDARSLEQALEIYRQVGHRVRISGVLGNLAYIANSLGNYDQGARYAREALELARESGSRVLMANALTNLGMAVGKLGDEAQASAFFEEALVLAQAAQRPWTVASTCYEWGEILLQHQQVEAAARRFQDLLAMNAAPLFLALAQWGLARVALQRGERDEAQRLGQASLEAFVVMQDGLADRVRSWLHAFFQEGETPGRP